MARQSRQDDRAVITDARRSHSDDLEMRQRRYALSMIFRTACFCMIFVVHGWWRVVAVGFAAIIPAIAVVLANARENHTAPADLHHVDEQVPDAPMLAPGPVIPGEVTDVHDRTP